MSNRADAERIAILEEALKYVPTRADVAEFKADIRSGMVAQQQATEAALSIHREATQEEFKSVRDKQTTMANDIAGLKAEFRVIKGLVLLAIGVIIAQFGALWFGLLPLPA